MAQFIHLLGERQAGKRRIFCGKYTLYHTLDGLLTDLATHLTEKGWFDDSYIGIDERGFSGTAFDLIESVKNKDGKCLKTAGAMDSFVEKKELAMRVTDLNVGDTAAAAHPADFEQLVNDREAKGLRTTLYSCTGHRPGNFSLSAPVESYWSIVNAGKSGTAGFLRWAYDAWVEDPLDELRIHSLSGIMDPEQEFHAVFIPHHLAECHADLAFFRELRGVGEEVYEDLGDPLLIADHIADVHVLHFHDIGDSLFLNCLLKQVPDLVCQVVEVEWLIFKLDLTDLNPGHIENFVDNGQKELGKLLCLHDIVLGAVPVKLAVRQVQHTDNSV